MALGILLHIRRRMCWVDHSLPGKRLSPKAERARDHAVHCHACHGGRQGVGMLRWRELLVLIGWSILGLLGRLGRLRAIYPRSWMWLKVRRILLLLLRRWRLLGLRLSRGRSVRGILLRLRRGQTSGSALGPIVRHDGDWQLD